MGPKDVVLDLGCGDGRMLIAAARLGARGIGYELDPQLAATARAAISADPRVSPLAKVEQGDAHQAKAEHVAAASVIALYMSESGNVRLLNALGGNLKPGTKVVSFCWSVEGWERSLVKRDDHDNLPIYLYRFRGGSTCAGDGVKGG